MVPTATVAELEDGITPPPARELRELKRRYRGDARRAGVRFAAGDMPQVAGTSTVEARPPWLVERAERPTR